MSVAPRRRWLRRALRAGVALALLILAAAVIAGYTGVPWIDRWAGARLRSELSRLLGRPVSVGSIHVSPFGASVTARDLVVRERPPGGRPVLEVAALSATLALRPLLQGRIEIADLRLEAPRASFFRVGERIEGPLPAEGREGQTQSGEASGLKIVLRRLELIDGVVMFEDASIPLAGWAEGLLVQWDGDASGNGRGSLSAAHAGLRALGQEDLGRLRAEGELDRGRASGQVSADWGSSSRLRADGSIRFPSSAERGVAGEAKAEVHLEEGELGRWLTAAAGLEVPVTGTLDGNGLVRFGSEGWDFEGGLRGSGVRFDDFSAKSVSADLRGSGEGIELRRLELDLLGGTVSGTGRIEPRKGGSARLALRAEGLALNETLTVIGLESTLEGTGAIEGTVALKLGDPGSLRVRARVGVTGVARGARATGTAGPLDAPRPHVARAFLTEGTGELQIDGSRIQFRSDPLRSGASTVAITIDKTLGTPELKLGIEGGTESLADASDLLESFLLSEDRDSGLPWNSARLAGTGTFQGAFLFAKGKPATGSVSYVLRDFAYEGIGAEEITGTGEADGRSFSFSISEARRQGGTLELSGTLPEGREGQSIITGSLHRWPVSDLLARLGAPEGSRVLASGPLTYRFGAGEPGGETRLALADALVGGEPFETGLFEASLNGDLLHVPRFELAGVHASLSGMGEYDIATGLFRGDLEASRVDVVLARPWLKELPVAGHASLRLHAEGGGGKGTNWTARLVPEPDLTFAGRSLAALTLEATGEGALARFEGTLGAQAAFSGAIGTEAPHRGEGRIELREVSLPQLMALARPDLALQIFGELGGTIHWSGPLDDPGALRAEATLSKLRIVLGGESFEAKGETKLALEEGAVRILGAELSADGSRFRVSGTYPIDAARSLDLGIDGLVDLGDLAAFIPELRAAGSLGVSLRATGSRAEPELSGSLKVENGRLRVLGFPLASDRISLTARVEKDQLVSESIRGWLGGGEFTGKGTVELEGLEPTGFRLEGVLRNSALAYPEGFMGEYSGRVVWEKKKGERAAISGDLTIVRGLWREDFNLDRVSFGRRGRAPVVQVGPPETGVKRTTLDLTLHADDNLWCRNDLADVEGSARIRIGGTIGSPLLSGRFDAFPGGLMRFSSVRYQIEQAIVTFPEGPTFNVEYDVTAETRVREYEIRMHLMGTYDHVDYQLTSNPPLNDKQILSLLLTGAEPNDQVAGVGATLPGQASTSSMVEGALGSIAGSSLQRALKVEELKIEPLPPESTTSTTTNAARVTIGKQITTRIFVRTAVSLNSPQNPIYQVEYLLTRHLQVILEQGELGALGGDIKYSTRFYGPGGGGERPEAGGASGKARAKRMISAVHFNGDPEADPDHLRRITKVREGDEFTRRRLVDGADRLKEHYVKDSYLEATVFPSMTPREGSAEVTFDIVPGPRISVTLAGAGSSERKLNKALKTLWSESRFGGDLMIEAEDLIRRLLHGEGYYACYVRTQTVDQGNERQVTFRIDRGEKVVPESVTIQGATSIPVQEIRQQVLTGQSTALGREPLKPEVLEADTAAIENLYRARGYLQAAARAEVSLSPQGDRALVALVIDEGPVSRVSRVRVTGGATYGEEPLRRLVASREGEPYLPARVESDRTAIQAWYDERGYPEAKVEAAATMDGQLVDLEFQVIEGGRKSVKEVEIAGNTVTATAIIRRQVPFAPGDPISSARALEVRQKLMKLGLFSDVQIAWADAPGKGDGQILRVTVRDAPNLFLRFGAGYDTDNGPRGSIAFGDTNLFGRGRYADIAAVYGSKLQRVAASYREPTPFDWLTSATLTPFYQNWVRESFTQRQYGGLISAEKKMAGPVIHHLTYTNQYSEVYDLTVDPKTFQKANPKIDLDPMRLADLSYAIVRDTRQPLLSATTGTYANALIRGFSPAIGSDKRFLKLFLQGGYYRPLGYGLNWATSARFGFGWRGQDEPIPLQEKYFAGGDSTVRGFGQDELGYVQLDESGNDVGTLEHDTLQPLGGEGLLIVNNELRKGIFGGLSAAIFLDAGNVYPRPTQILSVRPRFTAGIGLRYDTPVGPVRLEYGHKLDREEGEPGGELFLSLGQAF